MRTPGPQRIRIWRWPSSDMAAESSGMYCVCDKIIAGGSDQGLDFAGNHGQPHPGIRPWVSEARIDAPGSAQRHTASLGQRSGTESGLARRKPVLGRIGFRGVGSRDRDPRDVRPQMLCMREIRRTIENGPVPYSHARLRRPRRSDRRIHCVPEGRLGGKPKVGRSQSHW